MNTTNENDEQRGEIRQENGGRYERVSRPADGYKSQPNPEGRKPRPRIARRRIGQSDVSYEPLNTYPPRNAWQPRPANNYPNRYQDGEQPRYRGGQDEGNANDAGYNRGGYQPRNAWQPRPRPNNQNGEYRQYQPNGYRPRPNQTDYPGGYQPAYRRDNQGGGYQNNNDYNRAQRSYQPARRPQGNYRQGGYQAGNRLDGYRRQRNPNRQPREAYNMKKRIDYREDNIDPNAPIRLNKFLSNAGACSRREADTFIQAGVVSVNGQVVTELGTKVLRTDNVMFHDQPVRLEKKVYVLLNKPKDYVTTVDDPQQRKTVMDLVRGACTERIYPVGRLDRNTTGVLLLTNDGELASRLTHPQYLKKKVYHVFLDKNITSADMHRIAEGIELEDGSVRADAIEYASPTDKKQVGIEIHSGKNRIVRRIFESLGYLVTKLDRVQFCGLPKKHVRRGDWRILTEREQDMIRMAS
ncbi:MAG: RNA-binding S4 domain-containing protein, partial [Prevotella sp.]|nr:RNA-binding S4 domain-containing protein [Prevotella sp.]